MVKIEISRLNDGYHMAAVNDHGNIIHMDGSPDIGGSNLGMRPMQVLLSAVGGCSTIDVIHILKKQRQELRDIAISLNGDRVEGAVPSPYTKIHLHFKLFGALDKDKVQKAVSLAVEKYCSVASSLDPSIVVSHDFEIIP